MYTDLSSLCVGLDDSIHQAISRMDISRIGIVLVVDQDRRLLGTITDGDVRRAILANVNLDDPVSAMLARKAAHYAKPITAPEESDPGTLLSLLRQHNILHLPLVDREQRVVALVTLDEFVPEQFAPLNAVIMAGGRGSRLHPLTDELPKTMLPVGERPLLEIIVQQLRTAGIKNLHVAIHYKSEHITEYFGDGAEFGVEITYLTEDRPLGTAGSLGVMKWPQETTLVINGDILTQIDFKAMLAYHREHRADLTMAAQQYDVQVPYGVLECQEGFVRGLSEKPLVKFLINAGIYMLEPAVYQFIPNDEPYDMTELIQRLMDEGRPVAAFPIHEYWIDVGDRADYEQAQQDLKDGSKVQPST